MERSEYKQIEQLLDIPKTLSIPLLEEFIAEFTRRNEDVTSAARELDAMLALVQNHVQLLSLYVKQNYLIDKPSVVPEPVEYYTKQEIANKYRVSIRTVTNWIIDGLEVKEIGGVKRVSNTALTAFTKLNRGKKFSWKSIAR